MQLVSPCHNHLEAMDPSVSQKLSDVKAPSFNQGFSHACAGSENLSHRGEREKKKFTHKATPARCASHYERSCCIFLGSYMLSFDTQRSHGVRDAPSHGNSSGAFMRCKIALLTVKSIKQRAGIQPNGLHWFTTTSQWFAARIFFLPPPSPPPGVYFANLFYFARKETDIANSSVW